MQRIEGTKGGKRTSATWGSKKVGLIVAAVAAISLAAPGVASATTYSRSYSSLLPPPIAPVLAPTVDPALVIGAVSWSDVSWSDSVF
ncbi:MAG: hypothetical protein WBB74_02900 [Gaiellaceae bacterium]